MIGVLIVAIAVLSLLLSAFFSGAETGLYCINRLRLHLGVQSADPMSLRLASIIDDESGALSVMLIGTNVSNYILTTAAVYGLAEMGGLNDTRAELYVVLLLTPIVFVFGEVVPKNLFRLHADTMMARGSRLLGLFNDVFRMTGMVWCLARMAALANRLAGGRDADAALLVPKRRVARMLQEALVTDPFGQDQSDLIDRVCQLSDTKLHKLMIPRNAVITIAAHADRRELLRCVRRTGHARLPVFETDRRRIIGVVRIDELLHDDGWKSVIERIRSILTFGPHESVASAITRLQRAGRGMAVVADPGGRMLGIVTLKDLVGEVVGGLPADH
jgi:CBS domain containing-hemolysin-like protein